jgi:ankyrin repeat protein
MRIAPKIEKLASLVIFLSIAILVLAFASLSGTSSSGSGVARDGSGGYLVIVYGLIVLAVAYVATLIGALAGKSKGWGALLLVQTVVYLVGAFLLTRPEPWQKEEKAYDKAESRFVKLFAAKDLKGMERLLRQTPDPQGERLLTQAPCLAIERGPLEQVRTVYRLVQQIRSMRPAESSDPYCQPVNIALKRGDATLLQVLIEEGGVLSDRDMGWLVSQEALQEGLSREKRLALFEIQTHSRVQNRPAYDWASHLSWAFFDPELAEAVLRFVGGLDGVDDHGARAFTHMIRVARDPRDGSEAFMLSRVRRLVELGADVNRRDEDGTPLLEALCNPDAVDLLLRSGADPNLTALNGHVTPLHLAIRCMADDHDLGLVRKLIAAGADVNHPRHARPGAHPPVLQEACESGGLPELIGLLKRSGARVDVPDSQGRTSLMTIFEKSPETVHRLVACGARINARDKAAMTPLQYLLRYEAFDAAQTLCSYGAEPKSLCRILKTAKHADEMPASIKALSGHCIRKQYALQKYRYVLSDGRVFEGKTDATGLTEACDLGDAKIVES